MYRGGRYTTSIYEIRTKITVDTEDSAESHKERSCGGMYDTGSNGETLK